MTPTLAVVAIVLGASGAAANLALLRLRALWIGRGGVVAAVAAPLSLLGAAAPLVVASPLGAPAVWVAGLSLLVTRALLVRRLARGRTTAGEGG